MAKNILVVDDSDFFRQIYMNTLTEAGFSVQEAVNGQDALDKMTAQKPDLIFLDLVMPVKTGEEVLAEMKQHEELKNIPVVMLTSISAEVKGQDLLSVGSLAGYMTKDSATPEDILKRAHELLEVSGSDIYPDKDSQANDAPTSNESQPDQAAEAAETHSPAAPVETAEQTDNTSTDGQTN
jgi:CheY-like chemotaxis protein